MGIINISIGEVGQEGERPRRNKMVTTATLAVLTAAGYLNNSSLPRPLDPTDIFDIVYGYSVASGTGTYDQFIVSISPSGVITLSVDVSAGNVLLPVVSGDFAVFNGTTGQIKDAGYLPSDAAKTVVVMAGSAVVSNRIAHFVDTTGTIDDTAAAVTNAGDIYAGLSGIPAALRSYPATAAKGYLGLAAQNSGGDFAAVIKNNSLGQSSDYKLPDPAASSCTVMVAAGAVTAGRVLLGDTTSGLVTAPYKIFSGTTSSFTGGGTTNVFAVTGLTSACKGTAVIRTSTNSVSITKAIPSTDNLDITFSADPGTGTTVDYIYTSIGAT